MSQQAAVFLWNDYARSATVTASTTATGLAASNLIVDHRQVFWRSTVDTATWIQFTSPSAIAPTAIAIIDHNISASNTQLQVQSSTTSNFSGGTQTTLATLTHSSGIIFATWAAGTAQLYHRLQITDASNPNNYIQIGKVLLGIQFVPVDNWMYGFQRQYSELSEIQQSINGARSGVVRAAPKIRPLVFPISTQAELEKWEDFYETVRITRGFYAGLDRDNRPNRESFYCSFAAPIELPNEYGKDINEARMTLIEEV